MTCIIILSYRSLVPFTKIIEAEKFTKVNEAENSLELTIRVSNSLDPDRQA